jgi:glycosyltransferase involved in cell wall biosynthesis
VNDSITVITSTKNPGTLLEKSILSVINQKEDFDKYIIVDCVSSDDTQAIVSKYSSSIDLFICEPDDGIYDAWNKALKHVTTSWVMFLGADDFLEPHAFVEYRKKINNRYLPNAIISGSASLVNEHLETLFKFGLPYNNQKFSTQMILAHPTVLYNYNIFINYGSFNLSYKICSDYEYLFKNKQNLSFHFIDNILVTMTNRGVSNKNIYQTNYETFKIRLRFSGNNFISCFIRFLYCVLVCLIRK